MPEADRSLYVAADTWYTTHAGNQTTGAMLTANTMGLWLVEFPAQMRLDTLKFEVSTAASAGGVVKAGIYGAAAGGLPDLTKLLASFGSIAVDSTGLKDMSTTVTRIPRGRAYLAMVAQVAVPTTRVLTGWHPAAMLPVAAAAYSAMANVCYTVTGVSGNLPTSGSITGQTNQQPPRTFLHTAA